MVGDLNVYKCRISWQDSESTKSLKLQMLRNDKIPISCIDFIDIYEEGIHTIAVRHTETNTIFFIFRLKFENGLLSYPWIQFINDGDWYEPVTMEIDGDCDILISLLCIRGFDLNAPMESIPAKYSLDIPVFDTKDEKFMFEEVFYSQHSSKCTTDKSISICIENELSTILNYVGEKFPDELFDSKVALRLKLALGGM